MRQRRHLAQLYQILCDRLDIEELRSLCFLAGVEYDDLRGEGRAGKARELIRYLDNRRQVAALVEAGKKMRPDIDWPEMLAGQPLQPLVARPLAPTEAARQLKVFLCHASADKPQVRKLHRQLRACGVQPWLDEEDLLPGQDWQHEIPKAVQEADVVIVCLSQNATTKAGYIREEIEFALDEADKQPAGSIFLIPVRLEECDVPERLSRWQWVNLYQERGDERLMRALKRRAKTLDLAEPMVPTSRIPPWWEDLRAALVANWGWVAGGAAVLALVAVVMILVSGGLGSPASAEPTATPTPTPSLGDIRTRPADGMKMVYVPAGQFDMGSTDGDSDEQPVHTVVLDGFWIDRTEVTNAQYQKCVKAGECQAPTVCDWGDPTYGDADKVDYPVVCVDWQGAQIYCEWVGGRLPTEAEWEYAARGPEGNVYPWGDEFDCTKGNFDDETVQDSYVVPGGEGCDGFDRTAPVGIFPDGASWCGSLDMSGNVWEWVNDWYADDYYSHSPRENPPGLESSGHKVMRGGGWRHDSYYFRAAYRGSYTPNPRHDDLGFRCADVVSGQ